ncbi:uncharacterized protein BDZ83DRAFT_290501 [Colletotrichum acutatum]|uniref:Uncharacterized protein n=1 Tax=Glomerella acutata TaxID=27357 RepID=A0AAD8XP56_GLOAC|nr:uncharacterized protein BDZ83DRAFT_290501 [Colletotrichum acutatum]KAK1730951.1 hypothetical protein BDZ83DRAFT_290501 [Colletotrichum acutatum]
MLAPLFPVLASTDALRGCCWSMKLQGQGHDAPAVVRNRDPSNVVDREGQIKSRRKRPYSKGAHPPAHPPWLKSFAAESGLQNGIALHLTPCSWLLSLLATDSQARACPPAVQQSSLQALIEVAFSEPLRPHPCTALPTCCSVSFQAFVCQSLQAQVSRPTTPITPAWLARQSFPSSRNEVISCSSITVIKFCIVQQPIAIHSGCFTTARGKHTCSRTARPIPGSTFTNLTGSPKDPK